MNSEIYRYFSSFSPNFEFSNQIITIISLSDQKIAIHNHKISYETYRVSQNSDGHFYQLEILDSHFRTFRCQNAFVLYPEMYYTKRVGGGFYLSNHVVIS
jgi:hypothetical protein